MSSKTLCRIVRAAVIALAVCGIATCAYILPATGTSLAQSYPEFSHWYLPWLLFLFAAAVPCFAILVLVWKVSAAIKQEKVFQHSTARLVKIASVMMLCDVVFFLVGNVVLLLLNMNHPGILLLSLFLDVLGVALAVAAAVLSRYLTKAALLQEEADGTI